jgi:dihydrofolate reductase
VTPVHREISRAQQRDRQGCRLGHAHSRTDGAWVDTRIVPRAEAEEQIRELKRGADGDILVFGSHTLWNNLLAHGLVDELHLMIGPIVRTGDRQLFAGDPGASLRAVDSRTWPGSGNVLVRYEVT